MGSQEKHPRWQALLNEAHDIWRQDGVSSYDRLMEKLTEDQQTAFCLGKLNYQVENGGFSQWHLNGYSELSDLTLEVLEELKTETAEEVSVLLKDTLSIIEESESEAYDDCEDDYRDDQFLKDEAHPIICRKLDDCEMDDQYYRLNTKLMDEIEAHFTARGH